MLVAYYSDFQVDGSHSYIKRTTSDFILRYLSNMFLFYSMVTYLNLPRSPGSYHPVQATTIRLTPTMDQLCVYMYPTLNH